MALTINWAHPLLSGALDVIWSGKNTLTPVGALPTTTATGVDPDILALGAGNLTSGYIQAGVPGFVGHSGDMTITVVAMAHTATAGTIAGYDFFLGSTYGSFGVSINERRTGGYAQRGSIKLDYMPLRSGYAEGVSIGSDYQENLTDMPFYTAGKLVAVSFAFEGASASDLRTVVGGVTRASKFTRANVIPSAGGSTSFSGMGLGGRYTASSSEMLGANGAGSVALIIVHGRKLTEAEQQSLTADPWQVFNFAPDTTAPTLTSPSATATGATTASGSVTTSEANGTLYYLASANATETDVTVKAAASQAVTQSATPQSVSFTGLTAATPYYPHFLHRDAAGNDSAVASGAQFTTDVSSGDADPPTLTGSVTFASITQTSYTAQWPAGSDNVAVTGYEYQIGNTAGAWTDAGNNLSAAITGRTAGTTETVYVRAYDAAGNRSAPAISGNVTLLSPPQAGITVSQPLKNNLGTVWVNQSGIRAAVLQSADLVSVYETVGLTTNGAGMLSSIADTSIIAGQQYHVVIKFADGGVGITGVVTAS